MIYSRIIVFYFSGTGNAKSTAEWIISYAKNQDIETVLINISESNSYKMDEIDSDTLIGFCYPTHGFNAPPIVLRFINSFSRGSSDVFLLNTRAGMKLYKLFTPGLSGIALLLPALILKFKGYRIRGCRSIDLPSNWISLHPGLKKKVVESVFKRCKRITDSFTEKILSRKKVYRALYELPIDLAISPIAIGYYFYGRFAIAKTFFASYKCDSCGLCIRSCPVNAIELVDNRPFWSFSCESCMKCMNNCPKLAIETAHSFTFLVWWLAFSVVPYSMIKLLEKADFRISPWISLHSNLILYLIMLAFGLIVVLIGYRVLHFLLKYRFFNYLISYSSLTKYKFWRRYMAPTKKSYSER